MRRRRSLAVGLLVASLVAAICLPSPATAASPAHLTALTIGSGPYAVDGIAGTASMPIAVVASDDRGPIGDCMGGAFEFSMMHHISVGLTRTSGGATSYAYLNLTTRTLEADGEHWSGVWHVGATRGGTWDISEIWWCVGSDSVSIDPQSLGLPSTVSVTATHAPTATYSYVPAVAPYDGRQWVVATYTDGYGRPLRAYPIVYGYDDLCGMVAEGRGQLVTDSRGQVTMRVRRDVFQCLYFAFPGRLPWAPATTMFDKYWLEAPMYYRSVTAAMTPTTVRVGRSTTVTATVSPVVSVGAALQRLVGRTWRTVSLATVRRSGHVTFTYVPTAVGTTYLRVQARTTGKLVATASRALTLTAVRR